ncbi:MAG: hypothetical protein ACI814_004784, partial [Mariniblastus sp.]
MFRGLILWGVESFVHSPLRDSMGWVNGVARFVSELSTGINKSVSEEEPSLASRPLRGNRHAYQRSAFGTVACRLIVKRSVVSHHKSASGDAFGGHFA